MSPSRSLPLSTIVGGSRAERFKDNSRSGEPGIRNVARGLLLSLLDTELHELPSCSLWTTTSSQCLRPHPRHYQWREQYSLRISLNSLPSSSPSRSSPSPTTSSHPTTRRQREDHGSQPRSQASSRSAAHCHSSTRYSGQEDRSLLSTRFRRR